SKMSYEDAKNELIKIKGVGEKVANCVLLFSLGFRNAFPVDVWIKRIMEFMYFQKETPNNEIMRFAKEKFGEYGGYAQQYLFYYARENGLGK
ncbi:MAG: 8-oxoguanine DNA glycosylase, partial [Lachnospiraceae bacterium]|nr:8-oxoguanine DNA glycosylase [Lachnospiraceae bacterium]